VTIFSDRIFIVADSLSPVSGCKATSSECTAASARPKVYPVVVCVVENACRL
jgi:hypothetical protein